MRLLSRLIIALVVCLVAIALPAAPTQADSEGPSIRLSRSHGIPGTPVTVYGDNFTAEDRVYIYYDGNDKDYVETDNEGDFWVTFEVPESCTGYHTVLAEDTEDKRAYTKFKVEPGLTVEPEEGAVGTTVTVEGHGFAEDEESIKLMYYPDGASEVIEIEDDITANKDGWWERSFEIPSSHQGDHEIDAEGDESSSSKVEDATFEVTPGISLDTLSGSVGESITITGRGFVAGERDIKIFFAGEEVQTEIIRADDKGYWEEAFEVPEMPTGKYSVTAEGEWTRKEDIESWSFEIGPGLVLSPDEGHVGTNLTVTGHGFAASENVVIKYDASHEKTARTNAEGSFDIDFLVPESQNGARNVTAEVGGKTEAIATFTMESDAPETPELSSPPDGDRVGFIGKVRLTFEWSEVEDPSGVRYNLQIATSANFTTTEGFADWRDPIPNIVGTNYTLEKTEALPYGTYYWRVQAVDRAGNAGNWTVARSFRAGVMPLWAFIVIMVAVAGGIGTAVYFFVIRKRIYY